MATVLVQLLFVIAVFQVDVSKVNAIEFGKTDPASDSAEKTPCFIEPIPKFLKAIGLDFIGKFLKGFLCPNKEICPNTANWNSPKMYINHKTEAGFTITPVDLVDGIYAIHVGSDLKLDTLLYDFITNKAGNKLYAVKESKIVVYTRKPCSYEFEIARTEKVEHVSTYARLDPSENFLITTKFYDDSAATENGMILSYRLNQDGSMTRAGSFNPSEGVENIPVTLDFNPIFNIVAVLTRTSVEEIRFYNFNVFDGGLTPTTWKGEVPEGTIAESLVFSTNGRYLYLLGVGSLNIIVYKAKLDFFGTPVGFTNDQEFPFTDKNAPQGCSTSPRFNIHPNGKFLYASYCDSIGIFGINDNGHLKNIDFKNVGGHVSNFILLPNRDQLIVGLSDPNKVTVFKIDSKGQLDTPYEINDVDGMAEKIVYPPEMVQ